MERAAEHSEVGGVNLHLREDPTLQKATFTSLMLPFFLLLILLKLFPLNYFLNSAPVPLTLLERVDQYLFIVTAGFYSDARECFAL